MTEPTPSRPQADGRAPDAKTARLAEALRANLARRKAQARARKDPGAADAPEPPMREQD